MLVKIGIFTFHNQSNLGAVLQASALLNYLQNNYKNANVEIINYYPNNAVFTNSKFVHKLLSELKKIAEYIVDQDGFKRRKNFESYKKQYYVLSRDVYFGDKSLKKKKLEYDILISGSDQILNTTLTGKSVAYYLDFNTDAKKISYASSFGREEISDNETEYIKHKLINFSYLSMREQSGISIVDKLINKKANLVTDPVFLLEKKSGLKDVMKN